MGGVLQGVWREAQKWGVRDPDEVARLEVCDTVKGSTCRSEATKCSFIKRMPVCGHMLMR